MSDREPLTHEQTEVLRRATREAAAAFVDDLQHIRKVLHGATDVGDARRLSNVLRRLLVNGDLHKVAAPRIGRFTVDAPDEKPMIRQIERYLDRRELMFFATAGATLRYQSGEEAKFRDILVGWTGPAPEHPDENARVPLKIANYLNQRVFYMHKRWVTRNDVTKYIANVASGVHSGSAKTELEKVIASIRKSAKFAIGEFDVRAPEGQKPKREIMQFQLDAFIPSGADEDYAKGFIDPVLLEVLSTAKYLAESVDSSKLEEHINKELSAVPSRSENRRLYSTEP